MLKLIEIDKAKQCNEFQRDIYQSIKSISFVAFLRPFWAILIGNTETRVDKMTLVIVSLPNCNLIKTGICSIEFYIASPK